MPHIKLEHTENIEPMIIKPLFKQLRIILMENAGVKEENCKCKSILIPVYAVGDRVGSKRFFHLEILLLKGRPQKVRQKIGQKSLQILQKCFMKGNERDLNQFSVEIREMKPGNYFTSNSL